MENIIFTLLSLVGAFVFGLVVGWTTYRTLRRTKTNGINDIATVIGAVGGAGVTALFPAKGGAFGMYCLGLGLGFFGYLILSMIIDGRAATNKKYRRISSWLGAEGQSEEEIPLRPVQPAAPPKPPSPPPAAEPEKEDEAGEEAASS